MAGALRKTMVYLGLSEEDQRHERYDEYDAYDESDRYDDTEHTAAVTQLPTKRPVAAVVRDVEVGSLNRITTIHPRTYNEAKNIGEWFRDQVPVIMNLSDMDDADAKRLVDFAAGLVFGLHGTIERSNVSPVYEMSRLIEVNRAYATLANMMQRNDDLRRSAEEPHA